MRTIDKILIQLLVTNTTVSTVFGGLFVSIVSWSMDFNAGILLGLGSFLTGCGIAGSRAIFNWEKILADKAKVERMTEWAVRKKSLDNLNMRLGRNKDTESQALYEGLRGLYESFNENLESSNSDDIMRQGIVEKVELLFDGCIQYIEQALQLKKTASKLSAGARQPLLDQRTELLGEVSSAMVKLSQAVQQTQGTPTGESTGELNRLEEALDVQLTAQKRVAQRHPELVRLLREH